MLGLYGYGGRGDKMAASETDSSGSDLEPNRLSPLRLPDGKSLYE